MKLRMLIVAAVIALGLLSLASSGANADVILTYTGNDFTNVESPYTTMYKVTSSIILSSPLGDSIDNEAVTPIAFSINDGVQTITQNPAFTAAFAFSTDSIGMIIAWDVEVNGASGAFIGTINENGAIEDAGILPGQQFGLNQGSPGSWTISSVAVPEPSALDVFGTGLLGLVLLGWRRRKMILGLAW